MSFSDYLGIIRHVHADIRYQWLYFKADLAAPVFLENQSVGDLSAAVNALSKSVSLQLQLNDWQDPQSALKFKPARLLVTGKLFQGIDIQLTGAGFSIPQQDSPNQLIQSAAYSFHGGGELDNSFQNLPHFMLQTEQLTVDTHQTQWQLSHPIINLNFEKNVLSRDETLAIASELSFASLAWRDADARPMEMTEGRTSFVIAGIPLKQLSSLLKSFSGPKQSTSNLIEAMDGLTALPLSVDKIHVQGQLNQMPVDLTGIVHFQSFSFRQLVFLIYQKKAASLFMAKAELDIQSFDKQRLPISALSWYEYGKLV